jgi:hypothetical protein
MPGKKRISSSMELTGNLFICSPFITIIFRPDLEIVNGDKVAVTVMGSNSISFSCAVDDNEHKLNADNKMNIKIRIDRNSWSQRYGQIERKTDGINAVKSNALKLISKQGIRFKIQ